MTEGQKKYEFTNEVHPTNELLKRIRAVRSLSTNHGPVNAGNLGGWIESEGNLSHEGSCWVGGEAQVSGQSRVIDHACVTEFARVIGSSVIKNNALVSGYAWIENSTAINCGLATGNSKLINGVVLRGAMQHGSRAIGNIEIASGVLLFARMKICFSLTETPKSINTTDGYTMVLDKANGKISAGCRYFTFEEAIEHWKKTRGDTPLGEERLKQVEYLRSFM